MSIIQVLAPKAYPVSHADVTPAARADGNEFDDQLDIVIPAITHAAEAKLGRKLINQTLDLVLDCFPKGYIDLQLPNTSSIDSITYRDTSGDLKTLSASSYRLTSSDHDSKVSLIAGNSWPATANEPGVVRIRFICGYGESASDVPTAIRLWIINRCVAAINNPDGLAVKDLSTIDYVDSLLDPFIVWRVA